LGKPAEGLRLVALCFLIDQAIGHGDTNSDFRAVASIAVEQDYTLEQLNATLQEVADSYGTDRGVALLLTAFE
jgi:hypothetical protein